MKRRLLLLLALVVVGSPELRGLTLDEALARALEKNPRIQQAKTAVEQAAGQRLVFRSIALPVSVCQGARWACKGASAPDNRRTGLLRLPKVSSVSHSFKREFRPRCAAATSKC